LIRLIHRKGIFAIIGLVAKIEMNYVSQTDREKGPTLRN